jgi:GT2 family glycosyltransferase
MNDEIIIVFTNYKRKDNLVQIINETKKQTLLPKIVLIDNSSNDNYNKFQYDNINNIDVIKSDNSLKCWKRWEISFDYECEYLCIMDDDLIFTKNDILEKCYNYMKSYNHLDGIGAFGVKINKKESYFNCIHLSPSMTSDIKVDIIKGRFMFIRKKSLNEILNRKPDLTCDDIKISSFLKIKYIPSFLHESFNDLKWGNESLSLKSYQRIKREYSFKKYFK